MRRGCASVSPNSNSSQGAASVPDHVEHPHHGWDSIGTWLLGHTFGDFFHSCASLRLFSEIGVDGLVIHVPTMFQHGLVPPGRAFNLCALNRVAAGGWRSPRQAAVPPRVGRLLKYSMPSGRSSRHVRPPP